MEDDLMVKTLTVTWPEETFHPVQYNGFRIGPFSMTVEVPDGQLEKVYLIAMKKLAVMAKAQFDSKLEGFTKRLRVSADYVRNSSTKR
tara:strand:+ start:4363 stop:4626 length:264 start_codon:yes stop_codon:yes gene_type:complete